jgi:hypothetical protein
MTSMNDCRKKRAKNILIISQLLHMQGVDQNGREDLLAGYGFGGDGRQLSGFSDAESFWQGALEFLAGELAK